MAIDPLGAGLGVIGLAATAYQTCCQLWDGLQTMQSFPKDIRLMYRELQGQWAQIQQLMLHPVYVLERYVDPRNPDDYVVSAVKGQMEALKTYFLDCNKILDKLLDSKAPQKQRPRTPSATRSISTAASGPRKVSAEHESVANGQNESGSRGRKSSRRSTKDKLRLPWRHSREMPGKSATLNAKSDTQDEHADDINATPALSNTILPRLMLNASDIDVISPTDAAGRTIKSQVKQWRLITWAHHDKQNLQTIIMSIGRIVNALKGILSLRQVDDLTPARFGKDRTATPDDEHEDETSSVVSFNSNYLRKVRRGNEYYFSGEDNTVLLVKHLHKAIKYINSGARESLKFSIRLSPPVTYNLTNLEHQEQYFPLRMFGGVLWLQMHNRDDEGKSTFLLLEMSIQHNLEWLSTLRSIFADTTTLLHTPNVIDGTDILSDPSMALVPFADPLSTAITDLFPPLSVMLKRHRRRAKQDYAISKAGEKTWHVMGGDQDVGRWVLVVDNKAQEFRAVADSSHADRSANSHAQDKGSNNSSQRSRGEERGAPSDDFRVFLLSSEPPSTVSLLSYDNGRREASKIRSVRIESSTSRSSSYGPYIGLNRERKRASSTPSSPHVAYTRDPLPFAWLTDEIEGGSRRWKVDWPSDRISDSEFVNDADLSMLIGPELAPCEAAGRTPPKAQFHHRGLLPILGKDAYAQVMAETLPWHRRGTLKDLLANYDLANQSLDYSTVIDLSLELVRAQIILLRLTSIGVQMKVAQVATTQYEFFSPPTSAGDDSPNEHSYITQPWLSIGFGENRHKSTRPGIGKLPSSTSSGSNSVAELGLTLWQLASCLYEVQKARGSSIYRGGDVVRTRRVSEALRQMQKVERSCGLKYAEVVRMCLRADDKNQMRICRRCAKELGELRRYVGLVDDGNAG